MSPRSPPLTYTRFAKVRTILIGQPSRGAATTLDGLPNGVGVSRVAEDISSDELSKLNVP